MEWTPDEYAVFKGKPTDPVCSRAITIEVVGDRCIYLNDHRIVGGKPYATENLPSKRKHLTVRDALSAFSVGELNAYINEMEARKEYFADHRAKKSANSSPTENSDANNK